MKCSYCKTKISFKSWIFYFGRCYHCNERIEHATLKYKKWVKDSDREEKDSDEYWKKQEDGK